MPEIFMDIELPDNKKDQVYSPSSVISTFFRKGDELRILDFEKKVVQALEEASSRVFAKYGFECTSAMAEIARMHTILKTYKEKDQVIKIIDLRS